MKKIILIVLAVSLSALSLFSQQGGEYFIKDSDTTYCVSIYVYGIEKKGTTVYNLEYLDSAGNLKKIKDIVSNGIMTYFREGKTFDYIVYSEKRHESKLLWGGSDFFWRMIDGEVTMYTRSYFHDAPGDYSVNSNVSETQVPYVKYKDGLTKIHRKKFNQEVLPVVSECSKLKEGFKATGRFKFYSTRDSFKYYNYFCVEESNKTKPDNFDYFVYDTGDTVECVYLRPIRVNFSVYWFKYVDFDGGEHIICDGSCPKVKLFSLNGEIYEYIPLIRNNPKSTDNMYHYRRIIDGKVKVYEKVTPSESSGALSKTSVFLDGKYYYLNQKNFDAHIKPYLIQCEEFVSKYKGDFDFEGEKFNEIIKFYNYCCSD